MSYDVIIQTLLALRNIFLVFTFLLLPLTVGVNTNRKMHHITRLTPKQLKRYHLIVIRFPNETWQHSQKPGGNI